MFLILYSVKSEVKCSYEFIYLSLNFSYKCNQIKYCYISKSRNEIYIMLLYKILFLWKSGVFDFRPCFWNYLEFSGFHFAQWVGVEQELEGEKTFLERSYPHIWSNTRIILYTGIPGARRLFKGSCQ